MAHMNETELELMYGIVSKCIGALLIILCGAGAIAMLIAWYKRGCRQDELEQEERIARQNAWTEQLQTGMEGLNLENVNAIRVWRLRCETLEKQLLQKDRYIAALKKELKVSEEMRLRG